MTAVSGIPGSPLVTPVLAAGTPYVLRIEGDGAQAWRLYTLLIGRTPWRRRGARVRAPPEARSLRHARSSHAQRGPPRKNLSMEPLPLVDVHAQPVAAPADAVWTALLKVLRREMGRRARIARILGCDPAQGTDAFAGRPGEAVPGFRVAEAEPGRRLALRGRHRFASYALTFVIEGDRLNARTHAAFPGILGRLYRAAVVGSGGHRLVTRRLLRQVARAARGEPPRPSDLR